MPTFRIRTKSMLLTYPQDEGISTEQIHVKLEEVLGKEFIQYLVISLEHHQDGHPHHHVFIQLTSRREIKDEHIFDLQGHHCNIQACKAPKAALAYVKKNGEFQTWGVCPFNDSLTTKEKNAMILANDLTTLIDQGTISIERLPQLTKAIGIYETYKTTIRHPVRVRWYYGETGTGKTRRAIADAGEHDYWISTGSLQWFDGYHGQNVAILDDLRSDSCPWNFLLRLLDKYTINVPIKGGFVRWKPRLIIITAPCLPEEMFVNHTNHEVWDSIEQLKRRIDTFTHFPEEEENITEIDDAFWN